MRPIRAAVGSDRRKGAASPADLAAADLSAADLAPADVAVAPVLAPVVAAILPEPMTVEELDALAIEPGLADIEAAVELVQSGLATRVVLANFASWPGLLWQAYQLAEASDVLIIPTVVHPGGRIDIAVTRGSRLDG